MTRQILNELLIAKGLTSEESRCAFLSPSYDDMRHDPYLLPDMKLAVRRIIEARQRNELVYIYGDYDIDGLSATAILLEAFTIFGIRTKTFIPSRFHDGYGLSKKAVVDLAEAGAKLIVTVDCGSLSHEEIEVAKDRNVDVIVTDHHNVGETMPSAIATINPKRRGHVYPFIDLAGCGVAFKLVQALQACFDELPLGHEKWLLDLVALGTVCDVVSLTDENRANVYWGLRVLAKTRRKGLKSLATVAGLDLQALSTRGLSFVIGPHLNAAGRLETAQLSLDLITTTDGTVADLFAQKLHKMNGDRRAEQDRIAKEAATLAEEFAQDPVLVLSDPSWSHGIIGIVAAKILEQFRKPTFILQESGAESKGSARSYGDFSAVEGIRAVDKWLTKGGGHKLAAGVTLPTANIAEFRNAINMFYRSLNLKHQEKHLDPVGDVTITQFAMLDLELVEELKTLEPYGHGNPEPTFYLPGVRVVSRREMGDHGQHLKLELMDNTGARMSNIGFNQSMKVAAQVGDRVDVWLRLMENTWRGHRSVEGQLLKVSRTDDYITS